MNEVSLLKIMGDWKEEIEENHSSEKLFRVVDSFLYAGASVVLQHTTLIEECLAVYMATPTKKFIMNNQSPERADELIYKLHMASSLEKRLAALQQMKLNRDLLLLPLTIMADCSSSYCNAVVYGHEGLERIRRQLKVRDVYEDLTLPMLKVKYHVESYFLARNLILQKYYRMVVKHIGEIRAVMQQNNINPNDAAVE